MEGFPDGGVIGQTGGGQAEGAQVHPEQLAQQAAVAERQRLINQFLGTFREIGLLDSGSTRGILNGMLTDHVVSVANTDGMKELATNIAKCRDLGEDRYQLTTEDLVKIEQGLSGQPYSPNIWMSVLTTLQYAVIPSAEEGIEHTILW